MGCICSKHVARSYSSLGSTSVKNHDHNVSHPLGLLKRIKNGIKDDNNDDDHEISKVKGNHVGVDNQDGEFSNYDSINLKFGRLTEAEHVAAGWPSWLSAVAGEAIDGWLPLKSINFERFEKIGQGTYSSVYRGCHTEGGRMVALKKVRFDNLKPDSVKFMAREITILRMLDHPNIMKLEGIITSQLSCDIYLVFEYMEHDLSGLLSNPDIKFSDAQIKCYMRQLLKGIEHCHSLGILHRDIKTANILVNSKGILKIGDFGLAKFLRPKSREPLTSHVVTLWYRPPELLLGCTKYGTYVDLWSVGCVLAELFLGKPILKGQTEVEQLHKIFRLCGTPPDDYWNKSRLPLASMYKPHHAYESSLRERCKQLPETAVNLIDTLLSIEPCKRGSARSALESEYFNTKPYACDIASLPKYPPNQDIHAKETCRNKPGGIVWGSSKNPTRNLKTCQEQTSLCKVVPTEVNADAHTASGTNGGGAYSRSLRGFVDCRGSSKALCDTMLEFSHTNEGYQSDAISSLPIQATASNGSFMWAARRWKYDGITTHNGAPVVVRSASKRMPENGESTSRVWSGLKNCRLQSLNQPDSSKVHNSQDLPNDEEEIFFDARSQLTQ